MSPAVTSLIALGIAIVLSCTSQINVGVLAVGFAWVIGVFHAGMKADAVAAGFPVSLFVTLAGVTLLFGMAETNGTLARVTGRVFRLSGG
ncbi:MAG: C4-dicarboxylate ABC transporter, partial [Gemmatimonadetes bacterium]|nr:C4-dicarboxylate ABC transporter [Gemmatimonadota bacterium]